MKNKLILALTLTPLLILGGCNQEAQGNKQAQAEKEEPAKTEIVPAAETEDKAAQPASELTEQQKVSYAFGYLTGKQINSLGIQPVEFDLETYRKGFDQGFANEEGKLSEQELMAVMQQVQQRRMEAMQKAHEAAKTQNLEKSKAYLETNKAKDGWKTTESGLQYKVVKEGTGKTPGATDTVTVRYVGRLINGEEFDSSAKHSEENDSMTFTVGQVIKGWTEALTMMKEGSEWELAIPSELAYGENGAGNLIGPNQALLFTVELLGVKPPEKEEKKEAPKEG